MKAWVGIWAGVIGLAAFAVRSPATSASSGCRRNETPHARTHNPALEPTVAVDSPTAASPTAAPLFEGKGSDAPAISTHEAGVEEGHGDTVEDRERTLLILQHAISLTPEQRLHVKSVWRDRDAEVAAYHAEIRASKVLWLWGHDRRAREILATSQSRIAAALSTDQRRKYFELLEGGRLAEGVSFEVMPDITVVR